jgi:F-type H+-transporting ATPase subunit c
MRNIYRLDEMNLKHTYQRGKLNMHLTVSGGLMMALGGALPALAIGLIGAKAMEAMGRNPEASDKILPAMLVGMAFAEAIAIYVLVLAFVGT